MSAAASALDTIAPLTRRRPSRFLLARERGRPPVGAPSRANPMKAQFDTKAAIKILNKILELELAGVVRYTHYALMVYGYNRIPIVGWLNQQANEDLTHARQAGDLITSLGGHPSLAIGPLLESHKHDIGDILRESLENERESLEAYHELLSLVKDKDVRLEDFARAMVSEELAHRDEVDKMLRKPGETGTFSG
jgi:bacterioferritin